MGRLWLGLVVAAALAAADAIPTRAAGAAGAIDRDDDDDRAIQRAIDRVAQQLQAKYNMSLALAVVGPNMSVATAAGFTDAGLGLGVPSRRAAPDDLYVWGSTTKMFTAAAVLQLVERGAVGLADPIAPHIDPIFQPLAGFPLEKRFGPAIRGVQVQHLLHMTSGVADYDGEAYARAQFGNRSRVFGPVEIVATYVDPALQFAPGTEQRYCSTNYILLGLLLAAHHHRPGRPWSWAAYDQMSVVPQALPLRRSLFVDAGTCEEHTPVHGFMSSYSTASLPPQDVWTVSGVGGWSAGNYLGSVMDVARFTHALYGGAGPAVVSAASRRLMTNFSAPDKGGAAAAGHFKFYGMGTFNLDWSIGAQTPAYGHVGDTYGYQSQTTFVPAAGIALAVATNVETASQAQPAEATCLAYHAVIAAQHGQPPPSCTFTVPHRFIGTCSCNHTRRDGATGGDDAHS